MLQGLHDSELDSRCLCEALTEIYGVAVAPLMQPTSASEEMSDAIVIDLRVDHPEQLRERIEQTVQDLGWSSTFWSVHMIGADPVDVLHYHRPEVGAEPNLGDRMV